MAISYYISTDYMNKPVALYRLKNNKADFGEEVWNDSRKSWVDTENRLQWKLINGEFHIDKVTRDEAIRFKPQAFG